MKYKVLKYWKPEFFEISSYKYHITDRINKSYHGSGSDDSGTCFYTYNELGYRGDSIKKEGFKIMSIGCSITEGVGVNNDETWPYQFCKLVPNSVDMNFGTSGRSNDFIARCLLSYYDVIKPDLVLIMYTFTHRREFYTKSNGIEPFAKTSRWGYMEETNDGKKIHNNLLEIQNDNEDFINWYKNHLLIKYYLETKNCNWLWNGCNIHSDMFENNRFDGNYDNYLDFGCDGKHPGPKHNKKYSEVLYNYIFQNYRHFLPPESTELIFD